MLEFVLVFFLCKKLGSMLRDKSRKPIGYQILLVLAWFGSEFMTGVVWAGIELARNPGQDPDMNLSVYLIAIGAAAVSACAVFLLVHMLPDLNANPVNEYANVNQPFGNRNQPVEDSDNPFAPPRN